MKLSNTLVVFDLETTGTWVEKDKIVEIAIVKIEVNGEKTTYHKRVNPGIPIPPFVSELIGITDDDVKDAPKFNDIAQEVSDFIGSADFAGFNIDRFDLPLLENEFRQSGVAFEWKSKRTYDAQKVFHLNEKRDLTAAYKFYCGENLENAHSALADTEATVRILEEQVRMYGDQDGSIDALANFKYENNAEFYDKDKRFRWWNGKLYMMFGKYARQHSLDEIVQKDKGYLNWILSADFSAEVKNLVENALNGKFPEYREKDIG